MSLKGRAIRLKANMSTEEMLTQLKENEGRRLEKRRLLKR